MINDIGCFLLAYLLAVITYDLTIGYYYDTHLHSTGAIILSINYFLIRISARRLRGIPGQGEDVGGGALADFILACTHQPRHSATRHDEGVFARSRPLFRRLRHDRTLPEPNPVPEADLEAHGPRHRRQRVAIYADSALAAERVAKLLTSNVCLICALSATPTIGGG